MEWVDIASGIGTQECIEFSHGHFALL